MTETFERFGASGNLCGIFHASATARGGERTAVLFWNVGVFNRSGPNRQYVELARQLTRDGLDVFRFDLSGLGDSGRSDSASIGLEREVEDIRAAIDHVERVHGCGRVILVGFCSSAANAHPAAVADSRVVGLVMIDGFGYRTLRHRINHYARRTCSPYHWKMLAAKLWRRLIGAEKPAGKGFFPPFPPHDGAMRDVARLLERGVRCLFVYTGGCSQYYNYAGQFFDMFPALPREHPRLSVRYLPDADHLFSTLQTKARYQALLRDWLVSEGAAGSHDATCSI